MERNGNRVRRALLTGLLLLMTMGAEECPGTKYFVINVVDVDTNEPIPGVVLATSHRIEIVTDDKGNAAFREPGLMNRTLHFVASRPGYRAPKLFFGDGYHLATEPGTTVTVTMTRVPDEPFDPGSPPPGPDSTSKIDASYPEPDRLFSVKVVDDDTDRGVPMVEINTGAGQRVWTDNNGLVVLDEVVYGESMDVEVYSNGYEFDNRLASGKPGVRVQVTEGARVELRIRRVNVAERLYRITGAGQYNHSRLLAEPAPVAKPNYNAGVLGQDSVLTTEYGGKLFWIWGDTKLAESPFFSFHAPGATSELPNSGGLDPERGVELTYITDETEQAKGLAPNLGRGPMWLGQLLALDDEYGNNNLYARYNRIQSFTSVEAGLLRYHDASESFLKIHDDAVDGSFPGQGEPYRLTVEGEDYVYLGRHTRFLATAEALRDPDAHEVYTPINPDTGEIEYLWDGTANYQWRRQSSIADNSQLALDIHPWGHVRRIDDGSRVWVAGSGGAFGTEGKGRGRALWNPHRNRFVWIAQTVGQGSAFGELFYMEADTPMGPWVYANKIVSHSYDGYSFYNPRHHPYLSPDAGRTVYLEATYTTLLTDITDFTARHAYNQIMYKLDLEDARVILPVPVYELSWPIPVGFATKSSLPAERKPRKVGFFALDRPRPDAIPVYQDGVRLNTSGVGPVAFYALPADVESSSPDVVALYEYTSASNPDEPAYLADGSWSQPGYVRASSPLCKVWRNPIDMWFQPNLYQRSPGGECCVAP